MARGNNTPKKAGGSGKKAEKPFFVKKRISPAWTIKEKDNLAVLYDIEMCSTRFANKQALLAMGIYGDVEKFFIEMGCPSFLRMCHHTYGEVTRHFLATIQIKLDPPTPIDDEDEEDPDMMDSQGTISFRIGDKNYEFTIAEVCEALGFENGPFKAFGPLGIPTALWSLIGDSDEEYKAQEARIHKLKNPVIRFTARLLGHTFYARKDVATLQKGEYALINQGLGDNKVYKLPTGVNLGCVLIKQFIEVMRKANAGRASHGIYIGGVVTALLQGLGINLKKETPNKEIPTMDFAYLRGINFAMGSRTVNGEERIIHEWLLEGGIKRYCLLPNEYVPPTCETNIRFEVPTELYVYPDVEGVEQRYDWEDDEEDIFDIENMHLEDYRRHVEECGPTPTIPWVPTSVEGKFFYECMVYQAKRNEVNARWITKTFGAAKQLMRRFTKFTRKSSEKGGKSKGKSNKEGGEPSSRSEQEQRFYEEAYRHSTSTGGINIREPSMPQPRRHSVDVPSADRKGKGKRARYPSSSSESD